MAESSERSESARTSSLMALIANAHRDPKKTRAFKPSDFDPFARATERPTEGIGALRALFTNQHTPQDTEANDGA